MGGGGEKDEPRLLDEATLPLNRLMMGANVTKMEGVGCATM